MTDVPDAPDAPDTERGLRELLADGSERARADATRIALESYGPELVGWLCSTLAEADAHDAFAILGEELWKSLPKFDGRCSVRTWCYMLARAARARVMAPAARRREVLVSEVPSVAQAVTHVWNTTKRAAAHQQNVYAEIRRELTDEDQALLVLRVDKDLPWHDIALVLLGPDASADDIAKKSAALRKQFERVKVQLRELAARRMGP